MHDLDLPTYLMRARPIISTHTRPYTRGERSDYWSNTAGDDKGSVVALKLSPNLRILTEVQSHRDPKSGVMKSPPAPDNPSHPECPLVKWQKEELDAGAYAACVHP